MPQSLSCNYLHVVFSTKYRQPLIDENIETDLHAYLGGICNEMDCLPIKIGGYYDHVHILFNLSRKYALMKVMEEVKGHSSKWIKTRGEQYANFYWQDGYGAFSVSPSHLDAVVTYIANQHKHHDELSFMDECRGLYKKYEIDYDERYVWD
jgi:REP element-mobilizing transposase RayT